MRPPQNSGSLFKRPNMAFSNFKYVTVGDNVKTVPKSVKWSDQVRQTEGNKKIQRVNMTRTMSKILLSQTIGTWPRNKPMKKESRLT